MRYLELRRHTLRDGDNPHISKEGLELARRIGMGMGPYFRVISSPEPRCTETAIAMGFAVDATYEPVQTGMKRKRVQRLDELLPPNTPFATRAQVMQQHKSARKYCRALVDQWTRLVRRTPLGQTTLVITHGGYIDDSAVACLLTANHERWGPNFSHCEGIRLAFDKGYFVDAEILRVEKQSHSRQA